MLKKFVGDKAFYRMVLMIAVPIMIQNGFTNFVNMLDNLMVGRIGTDEMNGVAIVNQLIFVFNLSIFGGLSGAGIFTSQFHGSGNKEGVKSVFRVKLIISAVILIVGAAVLWFLQEPLIGLFLNEGGETGDPVATMNFAKQYLAIMLIGLLPFSINQCYISTLRELGQTVAPMKTGVLAVVINLVFNYILIFGKLGPVQIMEPMGVRGAAIATVLSRIVECVTIVVWTNHHAEEYSFAKKIFKGWYIPKALAIDVTKKGVPLLVNEFLWSSAKTVINQCLSLRGLAVVGALNITNTVYNVFNVVFIALGSSVAIVVGKLLGAGKMKEARDTDNKMIAFSVVSCVALALLMAVIAPFFPKIYNTTQEVHSMATTFILIVALLMPVHAFNHAAYFTLRSGGKTFITMLFDSCFIWVVSVPCAFLLARFTDLPIIPIYFACEAAELIKSVLGFFFVRSDRWMQNIVAETETEEVQMQAAES